MARYLVTGVAGFIGASVAEALLGKGHAVLGIDNLNDAYDIRLKEWRLLRLKKHPHFTFRKLDISQRLALARGLQRAEFEAVINLAARAGVRPSVSDPWVYIETNVLGTLNLLDLCVHRGVRKFVLASTSSLYGGHNRRPFREDADVTRPLSPYAASKGAAEMLCHTFHELHGLDITVLRYFTVYGPAGRPDMSIFRFVQWIAEERPVVIYGDGLQERDFTYVDDVARGTVASLKPRGYQIINLGSDHPVSINEVIAGIETLLGKKARIVHQPTAPADVRATWANIERARELLKWQPRKRLEDGLQSCVDWYLAERDWAHLVDTET